MLWNEFKFFFNLFFLLIALSQYFSFLKVGFLFTYIAPLVFVLLVTMCKEAYDDIKRMQRDRFMNNELYEHLNQQGWFQRTKARDLKVG